METKTAGQEFEDFVKFAMTNNVESMEQMKEKRKNCLNHEEMREFFKKNNITEEVFREQRKQRGDTQKSIDRMAQIYFHPTEEDFEIEKTERYKRLFEAVNAMDFKKNSHRSSQ